ncbi:hypothetical protein GCM10017708_38580 [Arthrobacter citreus]
MLFDRFRRRSARGRQGPGHHAQGPSAAYELAETDEEALTNAMVEWPNGGMKFPKGDIRSPFELEQMAKLVRPEDFEGRLVISSDPDVHRAYIQKFVDLGFDRIYLHNVGRNQREWIDVFSRSVLPALSR